MGEILPPLDDEPTSTTFVIALALGRGFVIAWSFRQATLFRIGVAYPR